MDRDLDHPFSLAGRAALVTGGGRGIGRAIALALARAGADVAVSSRTPDQIASVAREIAGLGRRAQALPCDVSRADQVAELASSVRAEFGRIDVLVHAAAISPYWKRIEELTEEEWDAVLDVNLKGAFLVSREVGRVMLGQGSGSVIQVASVAGMRGTHHIGAYAVSKAGLIGLTQVLAAEWASRGVRVNAIAPGWVRTEMTRGVLAHESISQSLRARIPLGRFAEPEQIAGIAVYLASEAASFVTGQVFCVDGGQTLG